MAHTYEITASAFESEGGESEILKLFTDYASSGKSRAQALGAADAKLSSTQFVRLCQESNIGGE